MIRILRLDGGLARIRSAFLLSIIFLFLRLLADVIVFSIAPSSSITRMLERFDFPSDAIVYRIVPGHTLVQPIVGILLSIMFCWAVMWMALTLAYLWRKRQ